MAGVEPSPTSATRRLKTPIPDIIQPQNQSFLISTSLKPSTHGGSSTKAWGRSTLGAVGGAQKFALQRRQGHGMQFAQTEQMPFCIVLHEAESDGCPNPAKR